MREKLHNKRRKGEDRRNWHTAGQVKRRKGKRRKQVAGKEPKERG
jgi:hypothetical protein